MLNRQYSITHVYLSSTRKLENLFVAFSTLREGDIMTSWHHARVLVVLAALVPTVLSAQINMSLKYSDNIALYWHWTELYCTAPQCLNLHFTEMHCSELICTSLHCTALHFKALHCTALHCTKVNCWKSTTHTEQCRLQSWSKLAAPGT